MNQDQVLGLVRHLLTALGGYAVAKGFVDTDTMMQIVGAAATIIGAGWSIYTKRTAA